MSDFNYEIYSSSTLPKKGWLQSCIYCRVFTTKIFKININDDILHIYLCNTCKNRDYHLKDNFINRVNEVKKESKCNSNEISSDSYTDTDTDSSNLINSESNKVNDFFDKEDNLPYYLKNKWITKNK